MNKKIPNKTDKFFNPKKDGTLLNTGGTKTASSAEWRRAAARYFQSSEMTPTQGKLNRRKMPIPGIKRTPRKTVPTTTPTAKILPNKTNSIAKDAITTVNKLKGGTGVVDKLNRWSININNTYKVLSNSKTFKTGARLGKAIGKFGLGGMAFAGAMGLTLALSKTRHGRD
jgi:hypothetical protein